jgi:hypothetical protein
MHSAQRTRSSAPTMAMVPAKLRSVDFYALRSAECIAVVIYYIFMLETDVKFAIFHEAEDLISALVSA